MRAKQMMIISVMFLCCLCWSFEAIAAQYDPIVEQVQKKLTELGYDPGPADGKMGNKTLIAIKSFQKDNGLLQNGEMNEATLKKLGIETPETKPPETQPTPPPKPTPPKEQKPKDPPKINCSTFNCTVENGLTDEMAAQIHKHLSETNSADEVKLKNGSDADLTKLPALNDVMMKLRLDKSEDITDLSPLAQLTNLKQLSLEDLTSLTDLTPLSKLEGLVYLSVRGLGTPINMEPVSKLTTLEELWIGDKMDFDKFDFLQPLANLKALSVYKSKPRPEDPADISALAGKPNLKILKFDGTNIHDLSPIAGSTELNMLRLARTPVEDLAPLQGFSKLRTLELSKVPVKDLRPLEGLAELKYLTLYYTEVTDLAPLTGLKNTLKSLNLNGTKAKDMTPIGELAELTDIYLDETEFDDYSPLAQCTKLEFLQARSEESGFNKLEVISSLPNLKQLWLDRNDKIQNWEPLKTATSIENLSIGVTSFSDLKLLENLVNLKDLNIYECTVKNPEALLKLPELRQIYISHTKGIDDITIFKDHPKLADLTLNYDSKQFPQEQIDALNKAKEEAQKKKQ